MAQANTETVQNRNSEKAAHQQYGQNQEPKQSQEESSSLWDGDEHSDAPGPFGTGSE